MTTHVLGIDEAFAYEAAQVKANLMRMIHVKEFSPEATQGLEPSFVLVIPDMCCPICHAAFDLDIIRDPGLNSDEPSSGF